MAPPEPGDAGNPFQSLLGDLMNMLGSTGGPDQWETTRAFAVNVATGGTPEGNVDPLQRITVEQLARAAELNVVETTGMPVSPDGRRLAVVPVSRAEWTLRALDSWRRTLTAMTPPVAPPGAAAPSATADLPDPTADLLGGGEGLAAILGQWMTTLGPMLFGLQVGSVVGHLGQRALGQYPLSIPWAASDELVLVTANIATFAADWSLPEEEALLWVAGREMAANTVLTRPSVRARLEDLLAEMARSAAAAQQDVAGTLGGLAGLAGGGDAPDGGADLESMQRMLGDPEALLGELLTPESRRVSEQLTAAAVVIDAYADRVADQVGATMVGSHRQLSEAWYRRRIERGKGEEAAGALFGLDLDQHQVDRGRAFVAGVVERAGEAGLARLWVKGRNLPTPAEVDAPGLWLERIDLPEPDDEDGGPAT